MNPKKAYLCHTLLVLLILWAASAAGAANTPEPHIGYLYPAGARQGQVVYLTAGGQFLRNATHVYVSGQGVRAEVVKYYRPIINLDRNQRQLLRTRLEEVRDKRLAELGIHLEGITNRRRMQRPRPADKPSPSQPDSKKQPTTGATEVKMPEHPLLEDLDSKSLQELAHIVDSLSASRRKRQINRQLAEMVRIKISIDAQAQPGNRELRILTRLGLSNPVAFQIGQLPEVRELEPNNEKASHDISKTFKAFRKTKFPRAKPINLPVVLNGQIMPGDIDRFRFKATQGQNLVIETHAQQLTPYLADAVPGWFQAVVTLYDARGNEVAHEDDYYFRPDPVLLYRIPRSGEYELQIHDAIYRGREDFVYRISISQRPFITHMFPLSARAGRETSAAIEGWNLPGTQLALDAGIGQDTIRHTTYQGGELISNPVAYIVDTLPQSMSIEPDDTIDIAQQITLPRMINGRIDEVGDIDVFTFSGKAGERIVAEIYGRRLNSPVDSMLRMTDQTGKTLAWNDDYVLKDTHLHKDTLGLVTHHADSYLTAELPADGTYYLHMSDAQQQGGSEYAYCLRVSPPQPDYALRLTPSSLAVRNGGIVPFCVHVLRKDGFDGQIDVALKGDYPGLKLSGSQIPPGCDRIYMTLEAPAQRNSEVVSLNLEGTARINGRTVKHPVVPAEDMMQAFLYRHLVPSQEFLLAVKGTKWRLAPFELSGQTPIRISAGDSAQVIVKTPIRKAIRKIHLELIEAPQGVALGDVSFVPEGLTFQIATDENAITTDVSGNLIIEALGEMAPREDHGKAANKQARRLPMGSLPAIPVRIVKRSDSGSPAGP